jgi:hypothetical protein
MPSGRSSFRSPANSSTRAIISHLQQRFGRHLPSPAELLAADPQVLRDSGFSARKGETLRALAERFVDGRLSEEALSLYSISASALRPSLEMALEVNGSTTAATRRVPGLVERGLDGRVVLRGGDPGPGR